MLDIERNTAAQACVNFYANAISILPLTLYFKNPKTGARSKAGGHPLYAILKRRPNGAESPVVFYAKIMRHILEKGNAYLYKVRSGGALVGLTCLNPEWVKEVYDTQDGSVGYRYNGTYYTDADILHIPSLYTDDWGHGKAPVDMARIAIQLGTQFDQASLAAFGQGINTKLLIKITDALKDVTDADQAQKIVQVYADYISRNYAGPSNAGKPFIQLNGMEVSEIKGQSSNREAELLESRRWQFTQICTAMGLPPWAVDGSYKVEYGGLENAMIYLLNFSLMPYLRHLEQRLATLLTPYEQEVYYPEFDFNILLRPDAKSRAETYAKLFGIGALSPDEIAAKENGEASADGAGAVRFVPANMMPVRQDVLDAYMASAKLKAAELVAGKGLSDLNKKDPALPGEIGPIDPSLAAGSQAQ